MLSALLLMLFVTGCLATSILPMLLMGKLFLAASARRLGRAGWTQLSEVYGYEGPPPASRRLGRSHVAGFQMTNIISAATDGEALYLMVRFFSVQFAPPLRIPWSAVRFGELRRHPILTTFELLVDGEAAMTVAFWAPDAKWIQDAHRRALEKSA